MPSANEFQKNVYHWWFWMSIHIKMLFLNISLRGIEDCICVNESTLTKQIWTKMDIFCKWTAKGVNKFPRAPMKKFKLRWNLPEATENLKKQKYWLDCGNRRTCFEVASKFRWYNKRKKIIFFSTTQFLRQKLLRKSSRLFDSAPINNTFMCTKEGRVQQPISIILEYLFVSKHPNYPKKRSLVQFEGFPRNLVPVRYPKLNPPRCTCTMCTHTMLAALHYSLLSFPAICQCTAYCSRHEPPALGAMQGLTGPLRGKLWMKLV